MTPIVIDFTAYVNSLQIAPIVSGLMMVGTGIAAITLVVLGFRKFSRMLSGG